MIDHPPFSEFYRALHGRDPLPWQRRLADQLTTEGRWPREVGVPTGLGKTTCLDIAVWWIASQAEVPNAERTTPTRIWWLVNRRLLVDSTTDHAEELADQLRRGDTSEVAAVAERLRSLSARQDAPPLEVVRLRGGASTGRPVDPSQPAVILSTLPMYGSRLLFRGYGSSRSMRPVDAALAGVDSLVLVDEAHLAHHLMQLFGPLAECDRAEIELLNGGRARPQVVALTATGDPSEGDRFDLDEKDHEHPIVRQRLTARKPMKIVELPVGTNLKKSLAGAALELVRGRGRPASCVLFVNTPAMARGVAAALSNEAGADELELVVLTGRQREREAQRARDRILDPGDGVPSTRRDVERERHLVVVATQTLEVGADVDFEYCVTEACGVRALTQRLGRLNRLGRFDHAGAVYVHAEPKARAMDEPAWPVYGSEPLLVIERLRAAAVDGEVDVAPGVVSSVLGPPSDDPGRAPELLPGILWEWVKTTTPPPGEAPVEPYFSGLADPVQRVTVVWRAFVPAPPDEPGGALPKVWPRVIDAEQVELPLAEAREALQEVVGLVRLAPDRVSAEPVPRSADGRVLLRSGDICIIPADRGLLDEYGWNPESRAPVVDVSLSRAGLPLDESALARVVDEVPRNAVRSLLDNEDPAAESDLVQALVSELSAAQSTVLGDEWSQLIDSLDLSRGLVWPRGEVPRLLVNGRDDQQRIDELDELSAQNEAAVELDEHGDAVGQLAQAIADALGLDEVAGRTVALSARFHDAGKADPRFQRWLDPQASSTSLLAKSRTPRSRWEAARVSSGWPRGGRHEALSGRLVTAWLDAQGIDDAVDAGLLVHLVVSHHGHGRPFLVPVDDGLGGTVTARLQGSELMVDADLSCPDWHQPDRFAALNRRYGHWGLCLLEAVVRQADHTVSAGGWGPIEEDIV